MLSHHARVFLTQVLFLAAIVPGCTFHLQNQIDEQKQAVALLQQETDQIDAAFRRYQADTSSELDTIRREIQIVKGALEENSYAHRQDTAKLQAAVDRISASLQEKQGQIEHIQKQLTPSAAPRIASQAPAVDAAPSDEQGMYDTAYAYFKNGEHPEARAAFEQFLARYPRSTLADNAFYWIGNSYFREKKYEEAITAFEDVIKQFPSGNKIPDAYYLQALAFCELQDTLTAQLLLENLMQKFPASQAAALGKKKYEELQAAAKP